MTKKKQKQRQEKRLQEYCRNLLGGDRRTRKVQINE